MEKELATKEDMTTTATETTSTQAPTKPVREASTYTPRDDKGAGLRKNPRRPSRRGTTERRAKPEFDQRIVSIRRVTRVVSGGRRFSFSVAMVIGDRRGSVGVGLGKATDTALAIAKAINDAKKNMLRLKLTKTMSIPYNLEAKYASSVVQMFPAPGRGVVAGSSVRDVIELGGIKDVGTKLLSRSKNKINNARVALAALSSLAQKPQLPVYKKETAPQSAPEGAKGAPPATRRPATKA